MQSLPIFFKKISGVIPSEQVLTQLQTIKEEDVHLGGGATFSGLLALPFLSIGRVLSLWTLFLSSGSSGRGILGGLSSGGSLGIGSFPKAKLLFEVTQFTNKLNVRFLSSEYGVENKRDLCCG
jgi:hypothetical protein